MSHSLKYNPTFFIHKHNIYAPQTLITLPAVWNTNTEQMHTHTHTNTHLPPVYLHQMSEVHDVRHLVQLGHQVSRQKNTRDCNSKQKKRLVTKMLPGKKN